MIRFLPEKNKKEIKIEYFSRVFVLTLSFLFLISIIAIFSIFPAYIISFYRDISIETQSKIIRSSKIDTSEQEKTVKNINEIISFLSDFKNEKPSVSLQNILDKANKDIKITQINYENKNEDFGFVIKGVSETREGLLLFVKDLKTDKNLSGVDLPVSDFVKSLDINFSIKMTSK